MYAESILPQELARFGTFEEYANQIKVLEIADMPVVCERMIGNLIELESRWYQFMETYEDYIKADTLFIERFYDDPSITRLNQCICDLCMTVIEPCEFANKTIIKGGKFAVYRFEGAIKDIFSALQGVFSVWLPKSGYEMDQHYGLNVYRKIDKSNRHVILDLCIPIK